jgi:hypothetical protein
MAVAKNVTTTDADRSNAFRRLLPAADRSLDVIVSTSFRIRLASKRNNGINKNPQIEAI